ncbi:MAG: hypothetical protein JNM43_14850 [Planctomycetaceae bacterium]|nr:hypothetical protein [Planctomycetaceae bacterium]
MQVSILGNSGSGKSTLARTLADFCKARVLDLDTVAWEPGKIAVPRDPALACRDIDQFIAESKLNAWVVEGCYGNLVQHTLLHLPLLIFLDPGVEQCLSHCRSRPFEPHKYRTAEEQNSMLPALLSWVQDYYTRSGEMSHQDHLQRFELYAGPKVRLASTEEWLRSFASERFGDGAESQVGTADRADGRR